MMDFEDRSGLSSVVVSKSTAPTPPTPHLPCGMGANMIKGQPFFTALFLSTIAHPSFIARPHHRKSGDPLQLTRLTHPPQIDPHHSAAVQGHGVRSICPPPSVECGE